ncbi:hypothetical protein B0G80_2423 [Paraburkholderia sp. BL6669N2]|uniref:hypothetical protein n=1 Tax=Paraburkholderia sp. BL6669N2 TaxID=1938807 RepID=UPI000E277F09|nr:hypothetical protein [Paraburkholderia sp. BL6669N2]REG59655.1 hypothetical protein B0G80_2423 [Paraburkholderia sp. BL6669N2]
MSASAIGLHDDQVRLASIAIHSNDINALAEARVKRIADNDIVAMMMGSVLQVRPQRENQPSVRVLPSVPQTFGDA